MPPMSPPHSVVPAPPLASPVATAAAARPVLHLRRALIWRIVLIAVAVLLSLAAWEVRVLRQAATAELPATASLVAQLLNDDLARRTSSFDRIDIEVPLTPLDRLGRRISFCVEVQHLMRERLLAQSCLSEEPVSNAGRLLAPWLRTGELETAQATRLLQLQAGIRAGTIVVTPNWDSLGQMLWERWLVLGGFGLGFVGVVAAVALLVDRSLRPANEVLAALARLEGGDLSVRLPPFALSELRSIAESFNRLAARWAATTARQRLLTERLLQVREEERRRLARELHDEMGQSLAALWAEAEVVSTLAGQSLPQLRPSADAMSRTTEHLLEGLQRVLSDLRPPALDRFGLAQALQALVAQPRRRAAQGDLHATLEIDGDTARIPDSMRVHIYRIVQEALTNAVRHGDAAQARVRLACTERQVSIEVTDNGRHVGVAVPVPGHGLLGMSERVSALGGTLAVAPCLPGGMRLAVTLPLPPLEAAP